MGGGGYGGKKGEKTGSQHIFVVGSRISFDLQGRTREGKNSGGSGRGGCREEKKCESVVICTARGGGRGKSSLIEDRWKRKTFVAR